MSYEPGTLISIYRISNAQKSTRDIRFLAKTPDKRTYEKLKNTSDTPGLNSNLGLKF